MKGNVTCSCGHSWNTSDSSKKDVNVCHMCGKDNTMKNGGWLDKYQDGGEVENPQRTDLFNQDTLTLPKNSYAKYTTDKEKSRLKGTSDNEEINKAADWLTNWYSSPGANRRLSESLKTEDPRQVLQDARDNINNVYVLRNSSRDLFNDDILENKSTDFNSLISKSRLLHSTINALKNEENYMSPTADDYTAGFYTPNGHIINITPGIDEKVIKGTSVHELTHASNLDKYYNNVGENILKKRPLARTNDMGLFPRFKQPKGTDQGDSQYIKRDGAYPRLMEMRYNSKINPNQVITPEQFKTIKKENPKNDLFRYYTDYDIINMLNHFAANDKPIQSDIMTAEYGADLNYNDSNASVGPGFEGDGYSNVGRNYSPAWGGQFQDGGQLITDRKDFSPGILSNVPGLSSLASGNQPGYNRHEQYGPLGDLYRYYGGLPLEHNVLMDSQYKPAKSKDKNAKYISLNRDPAFVNEVLDNYKRVSSGKLDKGESKLGDDSWQVSGYSSAGKDAHKTTKQGSEHHSNAIGRYTLGKGKDKKGEYISYYDTFDQGTGSGINPGELLGLTKPFEIYDRIYVDPKTGKPKMAMGGSIGGATQGIPGATGFMYARVAGSTPSKGKGRNKVYKTDASAQNGKEMKFYQEGLDFKPKSISKNGSVIKDDRGQWDHPGEITEIGSNQITMQGVPYPVMGVSDTGDMQMMYPDEEYQYDGNSVTEYPMMQDGGEVVPGENEELQLPNYWDDKMASIKKTRLRGPGTRTRFMPPQLLDEDQFEVEDVNYDQLAGPYFVNPLTPVESRHYIPKMQDRFTDMENMYYTKNAEFDENWSNLNLLDESSNKIKLNTGRFRGAKVPTNIIDELAKTSRKQNVPLGQLLTLMGRESMFGSGTDQNEDRAGSKTSLMSGWNVAEDYQPYNNIRFLADNKVPGVKPTPTPHGYEYEITDERAMNNYLRKNPKLLDQYKAKLDSTKVLGDQDAFDLAAKFLKKKGIKGYNPGDPKYTEAFNQDYNLLKQDKGLMKYIKQKGYTFEDGGSLELTKLDQLTNFTNYNTKQPGGWLDKYQ